VEPFDKHGKYSLNFWCVNLAVKDGAFGGIASYFWGIFQGSGQGPGGQKSKVKIKSKVVGYLNIGCFDFMQLFTIKKCTST